MDAKDIKDILVVNPGSTSTKITIFTNDNKDIAYEENVIHDEQKILEFLSVVLL